MLRFTLIAVFVVFSTLLVNAQGTDTVESILFLSDRNPPYTELYRMDTGGNSVRRLTFAARRQGEIDEGVTSGRWSWDGTKIVYSRFVQQTFTRGSQALVEPAPQITVMNADGSVPVRLGVGLEPAFSPDGQKIVYTICFGSCRLWTMNANGTAQAELITLNNVGHPTYSPDGSKILFHANPDGGAAGIYTVNADGSNLQLLAPLGTVPEFSPDGTKIAFTRSSDIFVMNAADASGQVNLTNSAASEFGPHWSSSGSRIIYSRDGNVFSIDANGQNTTQLTTASSSELATDVRTVPRQAGRVQFDFDGDTRSDVSVFRPSNNIWYIRNAAGFSTMTWGAAGDKLVPADYDNDGRTDIAVWRPSTGVWYMVRSQDMTFSTAQWGANLDYAVPGDYNGDGRADLMVFRASQGLWYLKNSAGSGFDPNVKTFAYGAIDDRPVVGDFDGDALNDIVIFRRSNSTWYLRLSNGGPFNNFITVALGATGDVPAPADFDGDGVSDVAVWRPTTGQWYIRRSSTGTLVGSIWGALGDIPVPADYSGDGKAEMAVFRPSNGTWYMMGFDQTINITTFGESTDKPVPNAIVPDPFMP